MKIGELAAATGVSAHTLRFYDRIGLLSSEARSDNNYRDYSSRSLKVVELIHHCKALGFTLEEIKSYLGGIVEGRTSFGDLRSVIESKIRAAEDNIQRMRGVLGGLEHIMNSCPRTARIIDCVDS